MTGAKDRFLKYVRFDTQSDEQSGKHPSTNGQRIFAEYLSGELRSLGLKNVRISEQSCLFAELPPTSGMEHVPVLGLIAHLDTSCSASGKNVTPREIEYSGGTIKLGESGRTLDPDIFPDLKRRIGETLIVTDGTTLLGADDKAGIAEIVTAVEEIVSDKKTPHGKICLGFTPDEEIGEGTLFFDVKNFGADYAYTLDGGKIEAIESCNFNAAEASIDFRGVSVHPGSAKNIMVNALKLALKFDAMLPPLETPAQTEGFEGFYHLIDLSGTVSSAHAKYILRDHDASNFARRIETIRRTADALNAEYGPGSAVVRIREQYRNMQEIIGKVPFLLSIAASALESVGLTPEYPPIRGGTDGAMLSFKGLPCPNLGTGGYNYHGEYEYLSVREMLLAVRIVRKIAEEFASGKIQKF